MVPLFGDVSTTLLFIFLGATASAVASMAVALIKAFALRADIRQSRDASSPHGTKGD